MIYTIEIRRRVGTNAYSNSALVLMTENKEEYANALQSLEAMFAENGTHLETIHENGKTAERAFIEYDLRQRDNQKKKRYTITAQARQGINKEKDDALASSFMEEMVESVQKAIDEAENKAIKTNAVIINEELDFSKAFTMIRKIGISGTIVHVPPMMLGKHVFVRKLPEGYSFAVTSLPDEVVETEKEKYEKRIALLEKENEELKEKMRRASEELEG